MKRTTATLLSGLALASALALAPTRPAGAVAPNPITGRGSALPGAVEASTTGDSRDAALSTSGRYLLFSSAAALVPNDANTVEDVYLRDLWTDEVELVSLSTAEVQGNNTSRAGAITPDGRYVAFWSWATNLVASDTNIKADVFVRDRLTGTTERVSVSSGEAQSNGSSPSVANGDKLDISSNGRYVAFSSTASNLGADANTTSDIFVRDRTGGTTELISVSSAEAVANAVSYGPTMSSDGRHVAFDSQATNLVGSDSNASRDVFVRDREAGNTYRVSLTDANGQGTGDTFDGRIDDSGTKVAFTSNAKLVPADTNAVSDVYVRDRNLGTTTWASVGVGGAQPSAASVTPAISGDGSTVAWQSTATNLVTGGSNGWEHIYVRSGGTTRRATVSSAGTIATGSSYLPALDQTGTVVAWESKSPNLVTGDSGQRDVFFRRAPDLGPFSTVGDFASHAVGHFGTGSASGVATAVNAGSAPAYQLVALANSSSWSAKRAPLVRLYVAYFKRLPDLGGFEYWRKKMVAGMKLDQVSARFAASNEFTTKYGNTTNTTFVTLVYQNVLGRQPDAAGLAHWVAKLDDGMSRGSVMTQFSESSEGKRHFVGWVQPTLLTLGMLGSMPPTSMFADLKEAAELDSPAEAALKLLRSSEYATKVV
ncbi:MAG: DUF4214 domain-containing protein [Acidimicrobiales bacterium]